MKDSAVTLLPHPVREQFLLWRDATLASYAQTFLMRSHWMGGLALATTFLSPRMGIAGLLSVAMANGTALLLQFPRGNIRTGVYGFNALLVGLGLSYAYPFNPLLVLLILTGSVLSLLLTVGFISLMDYYLHLPIFSLPFVIVLPLMIFAAEALLDLGGRLQTTPVWGVQGDTPLTLITPFPRFEGFFCSLGSLFFKPDLLSGLLLFLGMLLASRLLVLFSFLGYATSLILISLASFSPSQMTSGMLGVNAMLTAMLLGGVYVIPSPRSYLLAIGGAAGTTVVAIGLQQVLQPWGFLGLTLPFIFTTLLTLYAFKFREYGAEPKLMPLLPGTPEENMDYAEAALTRFGHPKTISFTLPFYGTWTVSQGIQGPHTHQEKWAYAWDFMVTDNEKTFHHTGERLTDYYTYHLPILAPADGTVVKVMDRVLENEIGFINAQENWGNFVIIRHADKVYSVLAHLAPHTLRVQEGGYIARGDLIGLCGNSGRSVEPHLHFHIQEGPDLQSRTLCPAFARFIQCDVNSAATRIKQNALPESGMRVKNIEEDAALARAFYFPIGRQFTFRVTSPNGIREEKWVVSVDFIGTVFIESVEQGARAWIGWEEGVFTVYRYLGPQDTALFIFAVGASLVPLQRDDHLKWDDPLPYRYFLCGLSRITVDVVRPFFEGVQTRSQMTFLPIEACDAGNPDTPRCIIASEIKISSVITGRRNRSWKTRVVVEPTGGPVLLRMEFPNGSVLQAEAVLSV